VGFLRRSFREGNCDWCWGWCLDQDFL